ncbi:TetR/AcrR family transcriptional regulator [Allobranchiibius sp. GilTou38]|uniref:TetR/AcrR family transcriptional regulator n=1 Tax=Allobranchiibius sp. GilTou38 TaxID=2815210 RepID=UPI001AA1CF71|nr:TetR/AcrR family transcriptional regulator [Allobranchiibius sp. GilTou38]MBO1767669.1 TetR/AcrR family transcriptional regulator [Allobranchiibius sp. GilTou38]
MTMIDRPRNPRGQGAALRPEIVAAAGRILDREGRDEAITLRAVAREVGISAPSIYAHFPDRDAIVLALIDESFDELRLFTQRAIEAGQQDPVSRLRQGCSAYLRYAEKSPHRYRLLFGSFRTMTDELKADDDPGMRAFHVLVDGIQACIDSGDSVSPDAESDASALWAGLHGCAMLIVDQHILDWDVALEHMVTALARLTR